jgi:polyisoprenoid-binding protein YceI
MKLSRHLLPALCALALSFSALAAAAAYRLDPAKSTLSFAFNQAGARSEGQFKKFDVQLTLDPKQPAAGKLQVVVQVGSLDTADAERDQILKDADLFNVAKFPEARFVSTSIASKGADSYEATGKLTIRGVTREARVPFTLKASGAAADMKGQFAIRRLDYGVGQGEWKSTEWVANDVTISFALRLPQAAGAT